jgi:hypothetical protein
MSNGFALITRLTAADWKSYLGACARRAQTGGWRGTVLFIAAPIAFGLIFLALLRFAHTPAAERWLFTGVLVGYAALFLVSRLLRYWMRPIPDGAVLGDWRFEFSPAGIRVRRPHVDSLTLWGAVQDVTGTAEHLFVWTDRIAGFVVPVRDLPEGLNYQDARSVLEALRAQAGGTPQEHDALPLAALPPMAATVPEPQAPRSLRRSMRALARWLTWRPFDGRSLEAPDIAILLVALLAVGLLLGLDRIGVGPKAEFSFFGAQVLACEALGLVLLAWITWRATDPQIAWRAILFVLGALTLLAIPAIWGIAHLDPGMQQWAAISGLLAIQLAYLARALRVATGRRQLRAVVVSFLVLWLGGSTVLRYLAAGPLWYAPENEASDSYSRSRQEAEQLLMSQPARIDAAVAAMPPRTGDASSYMVGFAGVGEQKVFAGEISLAAKVIGERYGTQQRTLLLVNDQRDLDARPLATVTGLKLGLAEIGRRMDRDHDVLYLVISSHGSEEPAVSVSNGGIPLNDLTGKDLKAAFEAAGIRWRVVVISACHAGAFIPYLSDERTIVITAAAAERTSFGCSNDRDLTNFGEAFIRDALPTAPSIRVAFEKARDSIAARERAENMTPSMPTAYFGAAIEKKLAAAPGPMQ